jgi:Galactose-1-phosphate uridylyltransferase
MSELRRDPISGRWVIIAIERGKRPSDFTPVSQKRKLKGFCPFCPGNENTTPNEIIAFRPPNTAPNTPGWSLRVVPNKFPALQIHGDLNKRGEGLYDKMNGIGAHEVIIETPDHLASLSTMPIKAVEDVLWAYYFRITDLKKIQDSNMFLFLRMKVKQLGQLLSIHIASLLLFQLFLILLLMK